MVDDIDSYITLIDIRIMVDITTRKKGHEKILGHKRKFNLWTPVLN